MSSTSASSWVKFFSNAGIPSPTNASYAHIFAENRIQMDMLSELNKEHLKEMGITPMGDIISILRHSKTVTDETVRSKILKANPVETLRSIAAIRPASPIISTTTSVGIAPARRVLPEQEGKYKVSLPKGTTAKTREILAKHSALQMDKYEKKSVFDRLKPAADVEMADSTSSDSIVKVGKVSSTVFKRLGDFEEVKKKVNRQSVLFSGILKNSPIKQSPKGVVKHRVSHRAIVRKSPPKKSVVMDTDSESDEKMDSDDYKQVSFSPEVEVLEIEGRRRQIRNLKNRIKGLRADGIKNRLGEIKIRRSFDNNTTNNSHLHTVKKTISMKPNRTTSPIRKISKMRSDQSAIDVRSRLDVKKRSGQLSIHSRLNKSVEGRIKKKGGVFNRLGK